MKVIELCRTLAKLQPDTDVYILNDQDWSLQDFEIKTVRDDIQQGIYEPEQVRELIKEGVIHSINDVYFELC